MKNLLQAGALALGLILCAPSVAQHASTSAAPAGFGPEYVCLTWTGPTIGSGTLVPCPSSTGSGGGGDASAANQTTQINVAQTTRDRMGDVTSPAAGTVNAQLAAAVTKLTQAVTALQGTLAVSGSVTVSNNADPATGTKQTANTGAIAATQAAAGANSAAVNGVQGVDGMKALDTVVKSTAVDKGVSITTGGTAQTLIAANAARRGFSVQNQSSSDCWFSGAATATADYHSLKLAAGQYFESMQTHVGTGAISIVCTLSGSSIYAREW